MTATNNATGVSAQLTVHPHRRRHRSHRRHRHLPQRHPERTDGQRQLHHRHRWRIRRRNAPPAARLRDPDRDHLRDLRRIHDRGQRHQPDVTTRRHGRLPAPATSTSTSSPTTSATWHTATSASVVKVSADATSTRSWARAGLVSYWRLGETTAITRHVHRNRRHGAFSHTADSRGHLDPRRHAVRHPDRACSPTPTGCARATSPAESATTPQPSRQAPTTWSRPTSWSSRSPRRTTSASSAG